MNATPSMTLGSTLSTTPGTDTQPQIAWPLPATKLPNGHLTWAEWIARQAATISGERDRRTTPAAQTPPAHRRAVRYLGRDTNPDTSARLVWPLPGTRLPNAHLTWAEWLDVLAHRITAQQPEHATSRRAA